MTSNLKIDKEVSCNLEDEFSAEDEQLFKGLSLTADQLKLKTTNLEAFWKSLAETVRSDLSDLLEDNQDLHRLKEIMEDERKDLSKENSKLVKIVNEAKELCSQYMG